MMKAMPWACSILFTAYIVALVRGFDFGLQAQAVPRILGFATVAAAYGYLLAFLFTKQKFEKAYRRIGIVWAVGLVLGLVFIALDDSNFERQSRVMEDHQRSRWFPLGSYTLICTDGSCWVDD
ncbi:MAG: hypothetical protein ACPG31_11470 [Planctomycetota bacterium]